MDNEIIQVVNNLPSDTNGGRTNNSNLPKKHPVTKKAMWTCGIAFGLCVALCFFVILTNLPKSKFVTEKYDIVLTADGEILVDGTSVKKVKGPGSAIKSSVDGSFAAINDGKTLYLVNAEKKTVDTVSENAEAFEMSASGNAVAYIDTDGSVKLYTTKKGTTKNIAKGAAPEYVVVSENAKAVAYTKIADDDDHEAYVKVNGKEYRIEDDLMPISVDDKADFVYCQKTTTSAIYVYKAGKKPVGTKISETGAPAFTVTYNGNEMIYSDGEFLYVSVKGKPGNKICEGYSAHVLVPKGTKVMKDAYGYTVVSPVATFRDTVVYVQGLFTTNRIGYVSDNFEGSALADDANAPKWTKDKKQIYFVKSSTGELVKYNMKKSTAEPIASDVAGFDITDKGKNVYIINESRTLCELKKGKTVELANNVSTFFVDEDYYYYKTSENGSEESFKCKHGKNNPEKSEFGVDYDYYSMYY